MKTNPSQIALDFRVIVHGISPLIWRKVRVNSASSLHDLHLVLYTTCEWRGLLPYLFMGHGQTFSVGHESALNARLVTLADLKLRVGESFTYAYRAHNPWQLEMRLLARCSLVGGEVLPVLLSGQRAAPAENLAGTEAYLTQRRHHEYHPPVASLKLAAEAVNFVIENNTRPDGEFMNRLAIAQAEIEEYVRFASPALDLERINRKLRESDSGGVA